MLGDWRRTVKLVRQIAALMRKRNETLVFGVIGIAISAVALPFVGGWGRALLVLLVLLAASVVVRDALSLLRFAREKHVPMIVIVGKSDDEADSTVQQACAMLAPLGFDEHEFHEYWRVARDDFVVRRHAHLSRQPREWTELTRVFEEKLRRVAARLEGRVVFHVFLNCPVALAVGLGASIRNQHEVVLYQYEAGPRKYVRVMELTEDNIRRLRTQAPTPPTHVEAEPYASLTEEVYVSIHLGPHDPKGATEIEAARSGKSAIHIRNKHLNWLAPEIDWVQVSQEVITELLKLLGGSTRCIHLVLSTPVAVAFAIGMGLGIQSRVSVYSWFTQTGNYAQVLNLQKLKASERH
jgi:hypothetical protein